MGSKICKPCIENMALQQASVALEEFRGSVCRLLKWAERNKQLRLKLHL